MNELRQKQVCDFAWKTRKIINLIKWKLKKGIPKIPKIHSLFSILRFQGENVWKWHTGGIEWQA